MAAKSPQQSGVEQDVSDFTEKLEKRRSLVESQGQSFESTPTKSMADESAPHAEADRAARTLKMVNGKWVDTTGLGVAGGDFRTAPSVFWNGLYSQFAPRVVDSVREVDANKGNIHRGVTGDFRPTPMSFWGDMYAQFAPSCDEEEVPQPSSPSKLRTFASELGGHVVGIPAVAQRFWSRIPRPFDGVHLKVLKLKKLSGTAATNSKGRVQHGVHFVKFKARKLATKTRTGLTNMQDAPTRLTKRTKQEAKKSLDRMKEKAHKSEVPAKVSEKAQKGKALAQGASSTVSFEISKFIGKWKAKAPKKNDDQSAVEPPSAAETVLDVSPYVLDLCGRAAKVADARHDRLKKSTRAQVSEKAQKGLEYVKEQARVTSTAFSTQVSKAQSASTAISDKMSQTAQKGMAIARNLSRKGAAAGA